MQWMGAHGWVWGQDRVKNLTLAKLRGVQYRSIKILTWVFTKIIQSKTILVGSFNIKACMCLQIYEVWEILINEQWRRQPSKRWGG